MDRSNFNPDQLHEHFDRIKEETGVKFVDNNRMIQLPTGHKFVVGHVFHTVHGTNDSSEGSHYTTLSLHGEQGEMGRLSLVNGPSMFGGRDVHAGLDLREGEGRSKSSFTFTGSGLNSTSKAGDRTLYRNPTTEQLNDEIGKIDPSGLSREKMEQPGTVVVAEGDEFDMKYLGTLAFNSRTGRYEHIPS